MIDDTFTAKLHLRKIAADRKNWTDLLNDNFVILDGVTSAYFSLPNFEGIWQNATAYSVGDKVVDPETGVIYVCSVANISASIPTTFGEDRTDHPSYWTVYPIAASARGVWMPDTEYFVNDFVVSDARYAICLVSHTSGSDFAVDAAAGKWSILVDLSTFIGPAVGWISQDTTYFIGAGQQFAEPGGFMDWLQQYRIAPGVTITGHIIDGTIVCTKSIRGHLDGRQIIWTNSGVVGSPLTKADFSSLDAIWSIDPVTGISAGSRNTAKAAAEVIVRAKFKVILEFSSNWGDLAALSCDGRHLGNWSDCPVLIINTGSAAFGVSTGSGQNLGDGGGGSIDLSGSYVANFTNCNVLADYCGAISMDDGGSLFGGNECSRCDFMGFIKAFNFIVIGALDFGWRGNHGGSCYFDGAYFRGNGTALEATNSPSMFWAHNTDIQLNFTGVSMNWGGTGKVVAAQLKNNARQQAFVGTGCTLDARAVDMASTATFAGGPPVYGIFVRGNGCVDAGQTAGVFSTITGHGQDIHFVGGFGSVFTGGSTFTLAKMGTIVLGEDAFGFVNAAIVARPSYAVVEVSGTTLTIPIPAPMIMRVVQPGGSAGTPISITTIDNTNLGVGETIKIIAYNANSGEVITVTDSSGLCLAAGKRYLSNSRDVLELFRPDATSLICEQSFKKNNLNGSGDAKRVRVKTNPGDDAPTLEDDIVVINKATGSATGVNMDAALNYTSRELIVVDGKGDANSNNITITPGDSKKINGASTYVINTNYGRVHIVYNGTEWNIIGT